VLQIPSVQMRRSTERPQVYDAKSSVKFDPSKLSKYPIKLILSKLESLHGSSWKHNLGDGKTSQRIALDLFKRIKNNKINGHLPKNYHLSLERSYREDGL
ncbi:UDP-N-acetyl glucosamine 2-epimerase, partial [Patescibacteria group bacterium]|nr:UDP-N-acetyl glucosamine 2-epimerase [Patescibacteria group bacterium]